MKKGWGIFGAIAFFATGALCVVALICQIAGVPFPGK